MLYIALLLSRLAVAASDAYCEIPKALYAWNAFPGDSQDGQTGWWHLLHDSNGAAGRLVDFAVAHRVRRVYLFVGAMEWHGEAFYAQGELPDQDAIAALSARLRVAGVETVGLWYLNDDPDDLDGVERVPDLVAAVERFNQTFPEAALVGLHGDQEPNDAGVYEDYLEMNRLGWEAAEAAGLEWGAALKPAWLSTGGDGPFVDEVMQVVSTGTLMDYTDDPARAEARGESFLAGLDDDGPTGEIALETGWGDPTPGTSFAELVAEDPDAFFEMMASLDEAFAVHPRYTGMAIHDYAQLFAGLHGGVSPYDYTGEVLPACAPVEQDTGAAGASDKAPKHAGGCRCSNVDWRGGGIGLVAALVMLAGRRRRW